MSQIKQVMVLLKTKAKHLGFSRRELRKVGNQILASLPEDIEDDNLEEAIGKKIDEYMPILQMMQSAADRQRAAASRSTKDDDEDDDDPDDDEDENPDDDDDDPDEKKPKKKKSKTVDDYDIDDDDFKDAPAWAKKLYKMAQKGNGYKHQSSRRGMVEEAVHGSGFLGKHILKEFEKKEFESDEDFEEYLDEVRDEVSEYDKERKERGLEKMSYPPSVRAASYIYNKSVYGEEMSDEEVKALARD